MLLPMTLLFDESAPPTSLQGSTCFLRYYKKTYRNMQEPRTFWTSTCSCRGVHHRSSPEQMSFVNFQNSNKTVQARTVQKMLVLRAFAVCSELYRRSFLVSQCLALTSFAAANLNISSPCHQHQPHSPRASLVLVPCTLRSFDLLRSR